MIIWLDFILFVIIVSAAECTFLYASFAAATAGLTSRHVHQHLQEIFHLSIQQGRLVSGNLKKNRKLQFCVFKLSCMLERRKSLYFCLIRGLHGILIGVVCSPNYSWFPSACPPSQTCQTCALKIKQLALSSSSSSRVRSSSPTGCRAPHIQMFCQPP